MSELRAPFTTRIVVRFGDLDKAGIVYYPRILHYSHVAFEDFFAQGIGIPYPRLVDERGLGFPSVALETSFDRPFRYGMEPVVHVAVPRVGATSVVFEFEFREHEGGPRLARSRNTTVCVDLATLAKTEVPQDLRVAFARHPGVGEG
jgi:4-hydroxybenzoyl-CoA thioesterase